MFKLDTTNFRDWSDDTKLKYFLSTLNKKVKKCINIYLVQQNVD